MQKNRFFILCMILTMYSNLQFANKKRHATEQPALTKTEQSKKTKKNKSHTPQAIQELPAIKIEQPIIQPSVQPVFDIGLITGLPAKDQGADLFSYFLRPVSFSKEGISHFFKYTYNHESYTEYLPYNFSHMIQFLEFGQEQNQTEAYAKSIIKLFLQKIKGCDFINSYNLINSMPKIADALTPYTQKKEASMLAELQKQLKNRFSNIFSRYNAYFEKNPDAFLEALAEQIAKKTNEVQTQQHIEIEHVRKDILRFLETCINKLIWSSADAYDAWSAINELANQSENFLNKNLITDVDALDDLYWSLIHRFCYFIDIAHEDISQETFIQIINDIHKEGLILFQIEEQESLITTKKDFLLKKIKNYCPYIYQQKEYKIYTGSISSAIQASPSNDAVQTDQVVV